MSQGTIQVVPLQGQGAPSVLAREGEEGVRERETALKISQQ